MMSFQARRELLVQTAGRYRAADHTQKSVILDEFVAATGYARKYAIRLLAHPVPPPAARIQRPRPRAYGPEVQEALVAAWAAANFICGKRLVPFLPQLVTALERHGHLTLTDQVRGQLLAISPATADRFLRPFRQGDKPRGQVTTRPGSLLKHQVPVRTFADWKENRPGFVEADLVAHCGGSTHGTYLNTFTLTDVATGWTECLPLIYRSQEEVLQALGRARQLLPFPLLGLDTDNGSEFLNVLLLEYCRREQITFTRGRAYRKNDQCHVEQKNGAVVRQVIGYDRYEGQQAYRQLTELYRALRLYLNFFQPSMKLLSKERDGAKVAKKYDRAQTPYQRVLASGVLTDATRQRLEGIYPALDPVKLRKQLETLQKAFWRHALEATAEAPESTGRMPERGSPGDRDVTGGMPGGDTQSTSVRISEGAASIVSGRQEQLDRRYRRSGRPRVPHTWRTRNDPFEEVWGEVEQWLDDEPERTAKSLLLELQQQYPGRYCEGQLRTLQRRVQEWRRETLIRFNTEWIGEEWAGEGITASELDEIAAGPDGTAEERRPLAEEPAMLMTAG
jgi:hypothetical protein